MAERPLTARQRAALDAASPTWPGSTPAELAEALGTSAHGACATASSLVRRGLLSREYRLGLVHYWRVR